MNAYTLYVFVDEAGNFDFSPTGTKHFIITSMVKRRPFNAYLDLVNFKYDMMEKGYEQELFHATEDAYEVRNGVFSIMEKYISDYEVFSTVARKNKTNPALRTPEKFYAKILGYNIRRALSKRDLSLVKEVIILTDTLPVKRDKNNFQKAVKTTLSGMLPKTARYRIFHHASKSNMELQIVDYFSWAIQRKWERQDASAYDKIKQAVRSEFDIFKDVGETYY